MATRRAMELLLAVGWLAAAAAMADTPPQPFARLESLPQQWRDDDGRELRLSALIGRRVVLTMAYASCHKICPMTIDALRSMQRSLDAKHEDAVVLVVGYDPLNDDATVWHAYRKQRHLSRANWHFLSGSPADTERLARALGFDFWKYDEHVMHDARVVVFAADGGMQSAIGSDTAAWPSAI